MKTLNLQLRFLVPLLITLAGAAFVAVPLLDQMTLRWFSRDLNIRGVLVTNALAELITQADIDVTRAQPESEGSGHVVPGAGGDDGGLAQSQLAGRERRERAGGLEWTQHVR